LEYYKGHIYYCNNLTNTVDKKMEYFISFNYKYLLTAHYLMMSSKRINKSRYKLSIPMIKHDHN